MAPLTPAKAGVQGPELVALGPATGHPSRLRVGDPSRGRLLAWLFDIVRWKSKSGQPYFHNGSAATLLDAVNFYDQRFGIGFTDQEKRDLVNFLNTL